MLTSTQVPGGLNWLDLGTPDIDAAVAFYTGLFGWGFESAGPEAGGYGFLRKDGRTVGAVGPLTEEGANPAWTVYFRTVDADATAKAVEQAGGTVRFPPMEVFSAGRMAGFTDPAGADFAVWQPGDTDGIELVNDPGSVSWIELYTTDAAAVKAFYGSVLAWETRDMPMDAGVDYSIAGPAGGGERTMHGGIMQLPQENLDAGSTSEWHPYFEVEDCDAAVAAARELGATVIIGAMETPGAGRIAMMLDPFGAPFAVIKSATY
ncbi:VOC family protein [Streptomyces sp. NBC_00083]|uniref:VOC family protein n=1 Tax=Streptomyces sp. NBC_00083 TaxID=2975647 RepID=UPI00225552A5|nr:VOC family protein [Streptomyces sp. NBC_00083]MCX5383317.1 VOC family protein [Streptomyces sp. NBC_00083]